MTMHKRVLAVLAAGVLALGAAAVVRASIPDGSGVIHGCYSKSGAPGSQTGALRVIDTSAGQTCSVFEGSVSWSQTGPPGPQGPQGARGPTGKKGDPGANAYFAGTGLGLSGGNTFGISGSYQLPQGCSSGQSPFLLGTPLSHPWSCFTAANADESCSSGKFQTGVDSSGDIECATPSTGPSGPDVWDAASAGGDAPEGSETQFVSLSVPAGTYLILANGTASDDNGVISSGNSEVDMTCDVRDDLTDNGYAGVTVNIDGGDSALGAQAPLSMQGIAVLESPADLVFECYDFNGSDHVDGPEITAIQIGTLHSS